MALNDWLTWRSGALAATSSGESEPRHHRVTDRQSARRSSRAHSSARWLAAGEAITIAGYKIPGGLLYVGAELPPLSRRLAVEPALIDPAAPVNQRDPDFDGEHLSYWPSYGQLHPDSRGAYLHWLSAGRQGPAHIGYVFLFFYGLERRVLADAPTDPRASADLPWIAQEVRLLHDRYGNDPSFSSYATAFGEIIDALVVRHEGRAPSAPVKPDAPLGRLDGKPLPADRALAWLRALPDVWKGVSAREYPQVLAQIFSREYTTRYGEGIELPTGSIPPTVAYSPASASFGGALAVTAPPEPDWASLGPWLTELVELADACAAQLDRYRARALSAPAEPDPPAKPDADVAIAVAHDVVTVRPARARRRSQRVPDPVPLPLAPAARQLVLLDAQQINERIAESAEVAALLASVFIDDEPAPGRGTGAYAELRRAPDLPVDPTPAVDGLDGAHAALVHALTSKPVWSRAEVDAAAAGEGLLPAGAIDTINEHAIDRSGEPLYEPTADGIAINEHVLEELLP